MSGDPNGYLAGTPFAGMASTHQDWPRQVVNLITDGKPNIMYVHSDRYGGYWAGLDGDQYVLGKANTTDALAYYLSPTLRPLGPGDEIDCEAVGTSVDAAWLRQAITRPTTPGHPAPPYTPPGWVAEISSYTQLANTLKEKFVVLFQGFENCATLVDLPYETNPGNNKDCIYVTPSIGN
jgi:hypothetical protein